MRYADPLAQAEVDRLARLVTQLDAERLRLLAEMAKVGACSDPTPPAEERDEKVRESEIADAEVVES